MREILSGSDVFDEDDSVLAKTRASLQAVGTDRRDLGACQVLLGLAAEVDVLLESGGIGSSGKFDNVTIPTYIKLCNELGLTPAGRARIKAVAEVSKSRVQEMRERHLKSAS